MKTAWLYIILFSLLGVSSCDVINPEEAVPTILNIDAIDIESDYDEVGSASHNISDVWVFADGASVGVFELPASIPILSEGPTDLIFRAGIKDNGISDTRTIYPFYTSDITTMNLIPGEELDRDILLTYNNETDIRMQLDFEETLGMESKDGITVIGYGTSGDEVFEGERSLKIVTNATKNSFQIGTKDFFTLDPTALIDAYMELDYKNDQPFSMYLVVFDDEGGSFSVDLVTVNGREEWNKIYVELGGIMRGFNANKYEFGFRTSPLSEEDADASFYFDNIKFVVNSL